jgi:hypothetical protein
VATVAPPGLRPAGRVGSDAREVVVGSMGKVDTACTNESNQDDCCAGGDEKPPVALDGREGDSERDPSTRSSADCGVPGCTAVARDASDGASDAVPTRGGAGELGDSTRVGDEMVSSSVAMPERARNSVENIDVSEAEAAALEVTRLVGIDVAVMLRRC